MTYSVYDRDTRDHTFPIATVGTGYTFGLVPADMVTHVMDEASLGMVVAVCCDAVAVLWSAVPMRPYG